ncbi:Zn-dependent alcohol dehydrogenase [Janibacter sp. GXQ6167]|uniref:Zn-dependent alcohol dehydrogenase n=1 Tax=Janibacter sp. GXQ6167 TaxID=3240791 RepID=UPI0035250A30
MKAAILESAPGELIVIDDVEHDAPGPREVVIQTAAAGVCHSDLHYMQGKYRTRLPTVVGHEAAGVVVDVGSDVSYVAPGDHVITCLSVFCGTCEYCLSGRLVLCSKRGTRRARGQKQRLSRGGEDIHQFLDVSAFAERMLVHENAVAKITPDLPLDRAALLGCAVTTGMGAVGRTAQVPIGASVVVIGAGGVGLNVIQGARIAGAGRIIAVDRLDSKLATAIDFGATETINASEIDAVEAVKDLTGGGVDFAFEAIGLKETTEQAFAMLRPGGTAVVVGMIPLGTSIELPGVDFMFEKRLVGSLMGSNNFRTDMPRYAQLYAEGRLKLDELVSARIGLEEVNSAFAQMEAGSVARSVIVF